MIRDLTVHEAMPGHFLQLARSNEFRAPTLVRAIFQSGPFIEGWAVYCEQVMAEQGYGGPEVKMQQLKMRLRAICNDILDQSIQAGNMTEKEAMDLMTKEGYQQEGEAVAKWKRARLTSAQLSTYFVGATEHLDLRAAEQEKLEGDFNLKKYNDQVISYGSPPVKYVRELIGLIGGTRSPGVLAILAALPPDVLRLASSSEKPIHPCFRCYVFSQTSVCVTLW